MGFDKLQWVRDDQGAKAIRNGASVSIAKFRHQIMQK